MLSKAGRHCGFQATSVLRSCTATCRASDKGKKISNIPMTKRTAGLFHHALRCACFTKLGMGASPASSSSPVCCTSGACCSASLASTTGVSSALSDTVPCFPACQASAQSMACASSPGRAAPENTSRSDCTTGCGTSGSSLGSRSSSAACGARPGMRCAMGASCTGASSQMSSAASGGTGSS